MINNQQMSTHTPVLLREMIEALCPKTNGLYLDATFGGGGYTQEILKAADCRVIGLDRDPDAIIRGKKLESLFPERFKIAHGCFSDLPHCLEQPEDSDEQTLKFDGIVFDFGVSSFQIDEPDRGFSFRFDGPLDMRMSKEGRSAEDIINTESESFLADLIYVYAEEKQSRRIAREIVKKRQIEPITTTSQLASLIKNCLPPSKKDHHPATLTFQALRIYINNELIEVQAGLNFSKNFLKAGGRLVAVTFHSLEDRLVKSFLRTHSGRVPNQSRHLPERVSPLPTPFFKDLYPKGITPTGQEISSNPRSRSARLRAGLVEQGTGIKP